MKGRQRKVGPIPQTKKELADKWLICPNCRKTIGQLLASGLIVSSRKDGVKCADCGCNLVRGKPVRRLSERARRKLYGELIDVIDNLRREILHE